MCHVTFGGVSNFDLHRRAGLCLTPESLSLIERRGVWRSEMDAERLEVLARGRNQGMTPQYSIMDETA